MSHSQAGLDNRVVRTNETHPEAAGISGAATNPAAANRSEAADVPASADEQRVATLLAEMTDALHAGAEVDVEAVAAAHPDLADEIRCLWATAVVAQTCAAADHLDNSGPHRAPNRRAATTAGNGVENIDAEDAAVEDAGDVEDRDCGGIDEVAADSAGANNDIGRLPRLFGDYELLEQLGHGGMGIVFKARQRSLGRIVALKMILATKLSSDEDKARFRAEAEAAARLDHPHIVPVYEVGEIDGQPYFTMKYVEGTTLAKRLAEGPMRGHEAARLLLPICEAIDFAHQRGILHRDLKPSNILIDQHGRPYVTDFGLAKRLRAGSTLTRSGAILGTPSYMAPEQAAGRRGQLGPATDVYSLGAVLYQTITGRPPFQSASPVDTLLEVLEMDPVPPHMLNARARGDLEMITMRCLQKPAELRYQTAAELGRDLQRFLAGGPVVARSGAFGQILGRLFRESHHAHVLENWGLLWMWHSLVLLTICGLTFWLSQRGIVSRLPYLGLWIVGLSAWAGIFWKLRLRRGPVTFVERQIAHVWGACISASTLLFLIEILLDLPVLTLSPILAVIGGMAFLTKAGILSGEFYVQAAAMFSTAIAMARWPQAGVLLFGIVAAACFFYTGWKYHRQQMRGLLGDD